MRTVIYSYNFREHSSVDKKLSSTFASILIGRSIFVRYPRTSISLSLAFYIFLNFRLSFTVRCFTCQIQKDVKATARLGHRANPAECSIRSDIHFGCNVSYM